LLILTGQRRGEVAGMRWDEIAGDIWTLPKERTKNGKAHSVPVSRQAAAIVAASPHIGDFVFSINAASPVVGFVNPKRRIDTLAGFADWRLHDLRRTAASGMARLGVNLPVIERILNHVSGSFAGIVGVYQRHEFADEKRAALQLWADHVAGG
jgi:integrase